MADLKELWEHINVCASKKELHDAASIIGWALVLIHAVGIEDREPDSEAAVAELKQMQQCICAKLHSSNN